jgi:ElaB/YqjD/DUF883 family membrane-anchored ribosome-binding protein
MSENYENKSPEQIQRDIERTRAEMGQTLDSIRQKLSPGQMLDEALDYLKGSGLSQFSSNLSDTVKHNPIPVALIGVGIAWLAMGGSRPPYAAASSWKTDGHSRSKIGDAASSVTAKAGQVMQGVRDRVGEASGRLGDMAHSAQERVGEAGARLGDMAHSARHQMGEAADRIRYQTVRAKDTYNYLRTEQPLILGVLGFALGAALGAGIPPTRQEDELMGEMRDEYVQRAKEVGEEYLEQGKQMATAAGEAVKEQAEKAGLTPDRETEKKPEHMPSASHHTVREEPAKQGQPS